MERSRWSRTDNLNIWKDQFDNVKNMTSENPRDYETGDGFKIFDITQLSSFLPKNMANVIYNEPYRHIGSNPDYLYIDNEKMLIFLNEKIGNLCKKDLLQRQDNGSKGYKGAKALFENNGDNMFFSELQKLFSKKNCLFDPIGFHKVCGNHFSLEDIANIDALATIPGFLVELSLYDEFIQKPFPNIDLNLLKDNSDGKIRGRANSINISRIGQYEVWKFLVILVSLYTALEDKILEKIGCFSSSIWNEGKLYFKSSLVGKKSGLVKAPLSEWGWGPHYRPVDNPCILIHPCKDCQRDYYRNKSIEPIHHWMNFHYKKE